LIIEVSDSTLAYDQGAKQRLYAKHNIAEYWIVDVQAKRIEVYPPLAADTPAGRSMQPMQ